MWESVSGNERSSAAAIAREPAALVSPRFGRSSSAPRRVEQQLDEVAVRFDDIEHVERPIHGSSAAPICSSNSRVVPSARWSMAAARHAGRAAPSVTASRCMYRCALRSLLWLDAARAGAGERG